MRYLSLNFGDENCASSHYRIHTYVPRLLDHGIEVECRTANEFKGWNDLKDYDGVVVQKKLFSIGRVRSIRRSTKRLVYDIDDAIWLPHRRPHHWWTRWRTSLRLQAIASHADLCLAANEVLGRRLRPWARKLVVHPMALDEEQWKPRPKEPNRLVVIGWAGSPANLPYLEAIEPALCKVQEKHPDVLFQVLCGKRPAFEKLEFEHLPWEPGLEPKVVPGFDIGLLPLEDSPFAAGKSPIKGLQYLASGVATVATPLEATVELFGANDLALYSKGLEEWEAFLLKLVEQSALRSDMARLGRMAFEKKHALGMLAANLKENLQTL